MKPLGTLLVRETHGIRRFLYPLATTLELPHGVAPADLGLARSGGQPVPLQCTLEPNRDSAAVRIDFAVSLAPYEQVTLILGTGMDTGLIDDPISLRAADGYVSEQRRVRLEFERTGSISQILYDGIRHLRGPSRITRNGEAAAGTDHVINAGPLGARLLAQCQYADGCRARTTLEISACKSWAMLTHVLNEPDPHDIVSFTLPLEASSPLITCDFGPGGGVYGKLQGPASPAVWQTEFSEGRVHWTLATAGRVDCQGTISRPEEYRAQCWFHWIDRNKSLAVAIPGIPEDLRQMTANLGVGGDITLSFELGSTVRGPAAVTVCYHFLNDIPPVSAATSPQSILLPPVVAFSPSNAI